METNQRLVLLWFLKSRVLRNPSREFWIATTFKLFKNLFRLKSIFFPKLRILSRKNNKPTLFILFRAMTVITSISETKRQFGNRLKEHQKAVSFCRKENSALSEHTCLTNHTIGWDNYKMITTNRSYLQCPYLEAWHINSAHITITRNRVRDGD